MKLKRQRGAISILAAASIGVAIIAAALALDLGRVYWVKRDLQKAADLASLSAVSDLPNADAIARRIVTDNYTDANTDSVVIGVYDWPNYTYTPGGPIDSQNAVQVTVSSTVNYYFRPGSINVTASAISAQEAVAGFSMGSFVARLDTTQSPLLNAVIGGLLGGSINLDLVSYQGLAAANITLAGIQAALNLGTVNEVLNADLLGATIAALQNNGDPTSLSAANTLLTLQAAMASDRVVTVGNVVKPDPATPISALSPALNVDLNVLQLLQMGAMVANGNHFIDIPNLGVNLGGLGGVGLKLSVISPPSIAIGPARMGSDGKWVTRAHSAQIRLKLNLDLNLLAINVHLPIYIESGVADGALTKIQCRLPKNDSEVTISVNPKLLSVYLGEVDDTVMQNTTDPVTVTEATLVNVLGLIWIKGYAYAPVGGDTPRDLVFTGPFDQYNNKSTASLGIGSQLAAKASQPGSLKIHLILFTFDAGPLIDAILNVLNSLLDAVLDPLLSFLGVSLGGADVTAFYLDCGVPQLVY